MTDQETRILFVDDEPNILSTLRRLFLDEDYELLTAGSGEEGLALLQKSGSVQVVVSDYRMPGMNGVDFLKKVHEAWPDTVRIVLSGYADTAAVVSAINEGQIYKFIPKPWNDDELKVTIANAVNVYFLQKENEMLTQELTATNDELTLLNEKLEDLVRERTAELLFQNQVLQHSQTILDSLPFAVIGVDNKKIIVQCNSKAQDILGEKGLALLGHSIENDFPEELALFIDRAGAQEKLQGKFQISGRPVEATACSFTSVDGQQGVILVLAESPANP